MINMLGQVMLYVNNQDEAAQFWTEKVGFSILHEADGGQGMRWIEVAPVGNGGTSIVLYNKELVAKMSPEVDLSTPSLMFFTENLKALHEKLTEHGITVGEIVNMPTGEVFNFSDPDGNYFAVMEKK